MVGTSYTVPGGLIVPSFYGYNITEAQMQQVLHALAAKATASDNVTGSIIAKPGDIQSYPSFLSFFNSTNTYPSQGIADTLMSSRLLGRAELTDLPMNEIKTYLRQLTESGTGSMIMLGLQGGRGPRDIPSELRGAVNPVWRHIYAHTLSFGTRLNATGVPSIELKKAGQWAENNTEAIWRNWAPKTGAYMNEANCFNSHWKHDFYGEYYDRLLAIKKKYDPSECWYVLNGIRSDLWNYDLDTGLLCWVD